MEIVGYRSLSEHLRLRPLRFELEKIQPPRPMTHDLIRDLFDSVSADVTDILIDELREGTFFAKIRYIVGGAEAQLDCRPSDAVALAVRVGAPIYVSVSVLDEAGIPTEEEESLTSVESSETEVEADPEPAEESATQARWNNLKKILPVPLPTRTTSWRPSCAMISRD